MTWKALLGRRSLSTRVTALSVLGVVFMLAANVIGGSLALTSDDQRQRIIDTQDRDMRVAWMAVRSRGQEFSVVDGKLMAGPRALDGAFDTVDEIKSLVGGAATIFRGDLRVATTIVKPDGSRATGTRLQAGPVAEAVLRDGHAYRGEADILGTPYFVAYDPIKAADGTVLGALFVGTPQSDFFAPVQAFQRRTLISGVVITSLVAMALFWSTRNLFKPLDGLRAVMERLAVNDNHVSVPWVARGDDIGGMARAVVALRQSALDKIRVEAEVDGVRTAADERQRRAAASLAEAASQQGRVVSVLGRGLARLADGDFTTPIEESFPDAYDVLRIDYNSALAKLRTTLTTVSVNAATIRSGTSGIATAADDLSRRTERQAGSLEETATALDEITGTVRKTASGANEAKAAALKAKAGAESSGAVVSRAIAAMNAIDTSSAQITQIIGVIDEIAFQTSLLALNAGVEAARAGDAGRGFAVVASEVRALAQRSADAAKEIKGLIAASRSEVERGVDLVGQTGRALDSIVADVAGVAAAVADIAASAHEQAVGLAQVNTAITQMDQVTQQNAAMVERSTAACGELAREANELASLVATFKLQQHPAGPQSRSFVAFKPADNVMPMKASA